MLLLTHYSDWQGGVWGRGRGAQISSNDNDPARLASPWHHDRPPRPLTRVLIDVSRPIMSVRVIITIGQGLFSKHQIITVVLLSGPSSDPRWAPRWREMEGVESSLFSDYFCFNYCSPVIIWRWLYLVVTKIPWPASTSARSLWDPHQLTDELSCSLCLSLSSRAAAYVNVSFQ